MGYLLTQMFLYMLGAFLLGLLLGWILWKRSGKSVAVSPELERLRAETSGLKSDLEASGHARTALERRLEAMQTPPREPRSKAAGTAQLNPAPAQLISMPPREPALVQAEPAKTQVPAPDKPAEKDQEPVKPGRTKSTEKPASKKSARKPEPPARPDDLRRIIGIGPANERRLHAENVRAFAQIASWTAADIRHIEQLLGFFGRIERERWIEQAQLLAVGDDAEFLRRFPTAGTDANT